MSLPEKKLGLELSESSDDQTSEDGVIPIQDSQQDDNDYDNHGGDGSANDMDNFVVEDGGSVIPDLPMAFSRHSDQDTRHDFKVVCQLFVCLARMARNQRRTDM